MFMIEYAFVSLTVPKPITPHSPIQHYTAIMCNQIHPFQYILSQTFLYTFRHAIDTLRWHCQQYTFRHAIDTLRWYCKQIQMRHVFTYVATALGAVGCSLGFPQAFPAWVPKSGSRDGVRGLTFISAFALGGIAATV
jgi:hypothetical protein